MLRSTFLRKLPTPSTRWRCDTWTFLLWMWWHNCFPIHKIRCWYQKSYIKKNAYALKTPHVVALPFIYGVECIQFHTLWATLKNVFWPSDLDLWPMTLTFKLDLDILPLDLHTEIQVCMSIGLAVRVRRTHTQTDRQTYGLRRLVAHTDVCSLCATRNRMRAPLAPPIFHTYEKYLWT